MERGYGLTIEDSVMSSIHAGGMILFEMGELSNDYRMPCFSNVDLL
jgi:hypothetical protein